MLFSMQRCLHAPAFNYCSVQEVFPTMWKRFMARGLFVILIVMLGIAPSLAQATYTLTIMHTNDTHTYHDPDADGNGGVAIMKTVIDQIRAEAPNSLLLDAGDRFTGTLYHAFHLGMDNSAVMRLLGFDAMTLGNHEFDNGEQVLADFIDSLDFPVVSANIRIADTSPLAGKIVPYVVLDVNGEQIGIIGLTTPETRFLAKVSEDIQFDDDLPGVVQQFVDELTAQGVNKIILLAHLAYNLQRELAAQVSGVDVFIGADSETLLSNIYAAAGGRYTARADGPYPTVVRSASNEPVLIVQAFRHNRFLGRLDVTFDASGVPTRWNGEAILMSRYIPSDPEVRTLLAELAAPLEELRAQVIGQTAVYLDGDRNECRSAECNMGNLVADAIRFDTGVQIAIMNGGGIRASIPVATDRPADLMLPEPYNITVGDILTVLPFRNRISTFELSGADVIAALENGVSRVGADSGTGRFAQVSGLRYAWDGSKPVGERIISVEVLNPDGTYSPIDPNAMYTVAANDFLRNGGDEYTMFRDRAVNARDDGKELDVVAIEYIRANSPVAPVVEGRITRVDG
jgi:5'-nucleotidase/UDP-sugar diphosphatase